MRTIGDESDELLRQVLRLMAVVGSVAYVPSVVACAAGRLWLLMAVDTIAYGAIIAAALSRASRRLKLLMIIAVSLFLAGVLLYTTGPYGAGYVWLVCAVFVSALFGGRIVVSATAAIAAAELAAYALLAGTGRAPYGQPVITIAVVAANLVLVCGLIGFAARSLIRGLEVEYSEKNLLALRLEAELAAAKSVDEALRAEMEAKSVLLKELQHRVRNNLQVAQSIVDIEALRADTAAASSVTRRMAMRMRALSVANDLVLSSGGADAIGLRELLLGIAKTKREADAGTGPISIAPFELRLALDGAGGAAVAASDLIDAIRDQGGGVDIGLEEPGGRSTLVFRWRGVSPEKDAELRSTLASDSLVAGLADASSLSFHRDEQGSYLAIRLKNFGEASEFNK